MEVDLIKITPYIIFLLLLVLAIYTYDTALLENMFKHMNFSFLTKIFLLY